MRWTDLKTGLENQSLDIMEDGTLVLGAPVTVNGTPITLKLLGAGTNKMAALIEGTTWVLLFGKPSSNVQSRRATKSSFEEEVETLRALGSRGVPVPKPFDVVSAAGGTILFEMTGWKDGDESTIPVFLMEFMSRGTYVEMPKKTHAERDNFASVSIVPLARVPRTIVRTTDDIKTIRSVMQTHPWGDFQVMYNKVTGRVLVFDPLKTDPNASKYIASMTKWLDDIERAIEFDKRVSHLVGITTANSGAAANRLPGGRVFRNRANSQ